MLLTHPSAVPFEQYVLGSSTCPVLLAEDLLTPITHLQPVSTSSGKTTTHQRKPLRASFFPIFTSVLREAMILLLCCFFLGPHLSDQRIPSGKLPFSAQMMNRHHKIVLFDNSYYRFYVAATFLPQKRLRRLFLTYNISEKGRNVIKVYFLEVSALFKDEARLIPRIPLVLW